MKIVNKPMEKGDFVIVMDMKTPFYGRVGKITKMDGLNIKVNFGLFKSCMYRARSLQVVDNGDSMEKPVDIKSKELTKTLCGLLPKDGINYLVENYNMDTDTASKVYREWRDNYIKQ